ncbi:molecular chaperone DnaJ [Marinimicrobium sp. C2-29]|uniref:molecular chaperone DnaJ n=1 Tax=Marinimicrobium sp. C2-29 TaxID=3139825 RepID=UPI0031386CB0
MIRLLIALIVMIGAWAGLAYIRRLPPEKQRKLLWRCALWGGGLLLVLMVATGRVHWIFAVIGALFPLAKTILALGFQLFPLWRQHKAKTQQQPPPGSPPSGQMTAREAMDTLGLKGVESEVTREEVIAAHRRLMQKLHPDRGGNDYLAAKVNEAKELLLKQLG